ATNTRTPTNTFTPAPTNTNTNTPTVTNTPVPGQCTRCHININRMTIACNPDGTVHWTAEVHNEDRCSRTENWTAMLQMKFFANGNESNWMIVGVEHGTIFLPGKDKNTSTGDFCFVYPSNATKTRVLYKIDSPEEHCHPSKKSPEISPCN